MSYIAHYDSPDLGFISAQTREALKYIIIGRGSLGESFFETVVRQAELGTLVDSYDPDHWTVRNCQNTIGLTWSAAEYGSKKGHKDYLSTDPGQEPKVDENTVFIVATDNLASRSQAFDYWVESASPLLIDMRSSKDLIRVISHSSCEYEPDSHEMLRWLYPEGAQLEQAERENDEGSCSMRGSMMHTLTAVSLASQHLFRWLQDKHKGFCMQDYAPWTGHSSCIHEGYNEVNEEDLIDFSDTYNERVNGRPFDFRFRTTRAAVSAQEAAEALL